MRVKSSGALMKGWVCLVAIGACVVLPFFLVQLLASPSLPIAMRNPSSSSDSCRHSIRKALTLGLDAFCTGSCPDDGTCFPRVRNGICISTSQVTLCEKPLDATRMPTFMRFRGERLTVPVVQASCSRQQGKWVEGLSLVADQRLLPYSKPNPHHEAEKLIPATLFVHKLKQNATSEPKLYWFSAPDEASVWARGFLEAVNMKDRVVYVDIPDKDEPICFEDAVLFSPVTNVRYVPDEEHNSWLRAQVLQHCALPNTVTVLGPFPFQVNASSAVKQAVILDRSGPRHLQNVDEIARVLSKSLKVPVRKEIAGSGSFCEQVSKVFMEDFMVVPHGSQNVNLLFARPGAQVIEVFPYLFYNTALSNFTHAARIRVHPLLGKRPEHNALMRLLSLLSWDSCYRKVRFCKNYSRRQAIHADIAGLEDLLNRLR